MAKPFPLRKLLVALALLLPLVSFSQIFHPVKWSASVSEVTNCEATITISATIDKGWHVYAQDPGSTEPLNLMLSFKPNANYELSGKAQDIGTVKHKEPVFDNAELIFWENKATIKQKIKIKNGVDFKIEGAIEQFGVCNDQMCLPPDSYDFSVQVKGSGCSSAPVGPTGGTGKADTQIVPPIGPTGSTGGTATVEPTSSGNGGCACKEEIEQAVANAFANNNGAHPSVDTTGCKTALVQPSDAELKAQGENDRSILGIFIAGFIGGLIALLTPCVFPMIPLTVSFFTKRSKNRKTGIRNAMIYALSIIVIYVTLGMVITITLGSDALNAMSSNAIFNLIFFVVFVVFAASFLGAFEITLPSGLVNKVDNASERGGLLGIFFMAFTLSLVSFSCTGPIIGSLLVEVSKTQLGPAVGMFGFALALSLPFALFALFPSWLNSLPKSGGWLNSVKVVLGFVELALALKFLSTVDLAYHWEFLKRELFLACWVVISILLGLYLLGKLKLSHDSDLPHVSVTRVVLAIIVFTFAAYLTPGIWGAPTNFVSGYLPPSYYREWKSSKGSDCPNDLPCFHDLKEGMCYAKKHDLPVMIDFTGYACVNCRKMEDNVWSRPEIYKYLSEKYVVISLYVDDKKELPEAQQYKNDEGKTVRTYGKKWSDLERLMYKQNSQPLYVLIDANGKLMAPPRGYTPEVSTYEDYLEKGIKTYQQRKKETAPVPAAADSIPAK